MPNVDRPLAAIFGCSGLILTDDERDFFRRADPFGFILFARNVQDPAQVAALVAQLRDSVGRPDAPVLIDQEGGRVRRLKPPYWYDAPPAAIFAALAERDPAAGLEATRLNARLIAAELADLGIDVDCTPVLDVPVDGAHDIIGDRAHGRTPDMVAQLGQAVVDGMLDQGVIPVIKHIPGHGRALADSHLELPVVDASLAELEASDFAPFAALRHAPWAMTAHVVYSAIEPDDCASVSAPVISRIVRGQIGFAGLLLSDDLSMKALKGDFRHRARAVLNAGCDVALHCNGDMAEMVAVAQGCLPMTDLAQDRAARAVAMKRDGSAFDRAAGKMRLDELLQGARP